MSMRNQSGQLIGTGPEDGTFSGGVTSAPAPTNPTPTPNPAAAAVTPINSVPVGVNTGNQNVTQNTDQLTTTLNNLQSNINSSYQDYTNASKGIFTDNQQADINNQVNKVGAQFDSLLDKANKEKGKGMGTSLVSAGEAGGFMNSQLVGAAAEPGLTPEQARLMDRYGIGGDLARVKSEYDSQISTLETQKTNAIAEAKSAAEKAIVTGKKADVDYAQQMFTNAQAAAKTQQELINAKVDYMQKNLDLSKSSATYFSDIQQAQANSQSAVAKAQNDVLSQNAPAILSMIQNKSPEEAAQILAAQAAKFGVEPTAMQSAIQTYQLSKYHETMLNTKDMADLISKTASGGKLTMPDGTEATVLGVNDTQKPTTLSSGGKIYQYDGDTKQWKDTGLQEDVYSKAITALTTYGGATGDYSGLIDLINGAKIPGVNLKAQPGSGNDTTVMSPSGNYYDGSNYAADGQAWTSAINQTLNNMGKFNSVSDIDAYIKSANAASPLTGSIIANSAAKNNIGWEELTAVLEHEALLGTSSVAKSNNNPGGVTWSASYEKSHPGATKGTERPAEEGGNYVKFPTMQAGVDAVAQQLANRKISPDVIALRDFATTPDAPTPEQSSMKFGTTGRTAESIYQNAVSYALQGGNLQQFVGGLSSKDKNTTVIKDAIDNKASAMAAAAGTTLPQLRAEYKALSSANNKIVSQGQFINMYAKTAKDFIDLAQSQSEEVSRTGAKLGNKYLQWARGEFTPSGPLAAFETYIYSAAKEYAKVTGGGAASSAALTVSASQEASKLLNSAQSPEVFKQVTDAMKKDMDAQVHNVNSAVESFSPAIAKLLESQSTRTASSSNNNQGNQGGQNNNSQSGGYSVEVGGQPYYFSSADQLNDFKKKFNL